MEPDVIVRWRCFLCFGEHQNYSSIQMQGDPPVSHVLKAIRHAHYFLYPDCPVSRMRDRDDVKAEIGFMLTLVQ